MKVKTVNSYLITDHSEEDMLVVCAALAKQVEALFVARCTKFVDSVVRTVKNK